MKNENEIELHINREDAMMSCHSSQARIPREIALARGIFQYSTRSMGASSKTTEPTEKSLHGIDALEGRKQQVEKNIESRANRIVEEANRLNEAKDNLRTIISNTDLVSEMKVALMLGLETHQVLAVWSLLDLIREKNSLIIKIKNFNKL
ncbi:hypothetical protein KJ707_01400 [Patescibacteria group bacterium]|nr:hypothetical protein [Patescibacteria group bacterium]